MSWISEANKLGKYDTTHRGFRIYVVKEGSFTESYFQNEKLELIHQVDFHNSERIAIDKNGVRFDGNLHEIYFKIDIEMSARYFDKREKKIKL